MHLRTFNLLNSFKKNKNTRVGCLSEKNNLFLKLSLSSFFLRRIVGGQHKSDDTNKIYLSMEAYQVSHGWELIIKETMRKINQGGFHGFSY